MGNANALVAGQKNKMKFSEKITSQQYQSLILNSLRDKSMADQLTRDMISAVSSNPQLQECEAGSILAAAIQGASLKLVLSNQIGHYYIVPFKQKEKRDRDGNILRPEMVMAQFVIGYKGLKNLALRTHEYQKLITFSVKEGEFKYFDPLNEELEMVRIEDYEKRLEAPTVGYCARFVLNDGFVKTEYWSKEEMLRHADRFSPAFSRSAYEKIQRGEIHEKDMWKYSSFWYKDFDIMAEKTALRHLLTHNGPMTTDTARPLVRALERDGAVMSLSDNGDIVAVDESTAYQDIIEETQPEFEAVGGQVDLDSL